MIAYQGRLQKARDFCRLILYPRVFPKGNNFLTTIIMRKQSEALFPCKRKNEMTNIIETLNQEEIARVSEGKNIPDFSPGDTLRVNVKIKEGDRERVQAYEGVCIARLGGGLSANFTVRKISFGEGVERVFPLYSPNLESIQLVRKGKVRRAKLYYLRDRRGKSARIAERTTGRD